ncbi:MAG TPA: hypothetical protein VE575_00030 [Acidimicrobiales bacterium]|nr:hypothetical protein [Acidimicrobiales bacterium]
MEPFQEGQSTHLRVSCQIIHREREADGTLIDLVTLEPTTFAGMTVPAGTPFPLAFAGGAPGALHEVDARMRLWEEACAVLDVAVGEDPRGVRYEFAAGHQQVVVTVDNPPDRLS